jgi:hypothetical protein
MEESWQIILKVWNPLSKYPPVSEARNRTWNNKLFELQAEFREKYKTLLQELVSNPLTPERTKAVSSFYHELLRHGEKMMAQKLKTKVEALGGKL